ncbi:MAG: NlpC/P60 family protein [Rubrobacteraceae bacterium]
MAFVLLAVVTVMLAVQARPAQAQEAVVNEARSWIGAPYDYSGVGYGVDCSEFTAAVFAQFGVSLPDDPAIQAGYGVPSNAKAGDLVYFNEYGTGISHIGIATGTGTLVHASSYFGVVAETPIKYISGYAGAVDVY